MGLRATVVGSRWMVTSSHPAASYAGLKVFEKGGNVVDAALAVSAVLCVVQNNMCGLGGDLFCLLKLKGKVMGLNGSGRAAELATVENYVKQGLKAIPSRGPLAAVTVPGLADAWNELYTKYATMSIDVLLRDAVRLARKGFAIPRGYANSINAASEHLGQYTNWRKIFLGESTRVAPGHILIQSDLANSLELIASEGPRSLYEGELAKKIASGAEKLGSPIRAEDLAKHRSTWDEPLATEYRGVKVYETAPNSQGAAVLLWLNMLSELTLRGKPWDSAETTKLLYRTCALAYRERARSISDPTSFPLPSDFLSKAFARSLLTESRDGLQMSPSKPDLGDTTYFAVADSEGNCASVIQSNYMGFGSGIVPEGAGIVLHNRGCYFSLDPSHHNSLRPGKRTFHTLCASIGEKEGKTKFVLGSMGGDVQPQIHVQLITKLLDFNMDIQDAIDAPRWVALGTIYDCGQSLLIEKDLENLIPELRATGLTFSPIPPRSSITGHAQGIIFGEEGELHAGADPRGDGAALGI